MPGIKTYMMKKSVLLILTLILSVPAFSSEKAEKSDAPVKEHLQNHFKFYGFIRNYFAFDSRESVSGTGDLFYYLPKDVLWNENHTEDLNAQPSFRYLSLTSRVGVDVNGYYIGNLHFGAKIEADFYSGLSSTSVKGFFPQNSKGENSKVSGTAQLRLRQAYATLSWKDLPMSEDQTATVGLKIGQAWHPMGADMPHLFSLEAGAPFGPFSRTPLVQMDADLGSHWTITAAAIWQMQYQSAGPAGSSAVYMKYGMTPEMYVAAAYRSKGFVLRAGADLVSIKPRVFGEKDGITVRVSDRKTSLLYYLYAQYSKDKFAVKAKTTYGEGGEHMNLMSGYAKVGVNEADGSWNYASLNASSSWVSFCYGKKWQGVLFLGYVKNFGLAEPVKDGKILKEDVYFCSNGFSNIDQMYRINPQVIYNIGKLNVGLEYQWTNVYYGEYYKENGKDYLSSYAKADMNRHWVGNHRVNLMVKYNF